MSIMLLVGAGLLVRSLWELQGVNPGFAAHQLLTLEVALPTARYEEGEQMPFYQRFEERLRSLAGVTGVGAVNILPLSESYDSRGVQVEDHPRPEGQGLSPQAQVGHPRLLRGHGHDPRPRARLRCAGHRRPAVGGGRERVDGEEVLAWRIERDRQAHHLQQRHSSRAAAERGRCRVARDRGSRRRRETPGPGRGGGAHVLHAAHPAALVSHHARRRARVGRSGHAHPPGAHRARAVGQPGAAVAGANDVERARRDCRRTAHARHAAGTVRGAGVGCWPRSASTASSPTWWASGRRKLAFAARWAPGRPTCVSMLVREAMRPVVLGMVVGVVGAVGHDAALSAMLYGVSTTDVWTYVAACTALGLAALAASIIPARRALAWIRSPPCEGPTPTSYEGSGPLQPGNPASLARAAKREFVPRNGIEVELPRLQALVIDGELTGDLGGGIDDDHRRPAGIRVDVRSR